ncbi:ectonucleoside triphosphate diphosphohydrolase 5, partial [Clarias magur]
MPQFLLPVVSMWLLSGYFLAEATYYNHPLYNRHLYNYRHRIFNHQASMDNLLPPEVPAEVEPPKPRIFHGIMFDAGSSGTRIHIYKFIQKDRNGLPVLDNEMYNAVKPGLSAYRDNPEEGGETIRQLLKVAKKTIPKEEWWQTPVLLKATAGLRMMPEEKARGLLDEKTVESAPHDYIAQFDIFNTTYKLYTHSYLGNGVFAARLATLGALGADGLDYKVFTSSCLPKKFREDWTFGGITYKVSGIPDGYAGYKLCYHEVLRVVKGIIHQPYEVKGNSVFYAFSYYFDRAVESGLIDGSRGGSVEVRDFKKRAKEVCNKMTKYRPINPFLCMDMTYITVLLKEGFGFKDNTVLQLAKKVNNFETSWALGATFDYFHNLNI